MAIAIASGVTPERGLYTAIVGGFLVSALGGSRFQIGGPPTVKPLPFGGYGFRYGLFSRNTCSGVAVWPA